MEDRMTPAAGQSSRRVKLSRVCESSRLQSQLLAQAYQRVCPHIRARPGSGVTRGTGIERDSSSAARVAAGA
jgi:hypothetical protein